MKTTITALLIAATSALAQPTNFNDLKNNFDYPTRASMFNVSPINTNSSFTISPQQASWMKMSNIVFVVDTTASNITVTLPTYFENTFSILNRGTNWVTIQSAEGNTILLAPLDGTVTYSTNLVNKYVMKVHTLFHINASNVVVQSEFKPLPNVVFLVTNNMSLVKSQVGLASVDNTADTAKPVSTDQEARILGATNGLYGVVQPLDSDLTSIAAITTTAFGRGLLDETDAASTRTTIGAGTSSFDGVFASLTSKPTTIGGYGITDFNSLGDARWQIGSANLTNWAALAPAAKQDASANLTAWSAIATATKEAAITTGTTAQYWRGDKSFQTLDKSAVGLGNVDNTADTAKPVSTAQQTALNLKADLASPTFTGTVTVPDSSFVLAKLANMATASIYYRKTAGSGAPEVNTVATLKTDLALVKADVGLGSVDNTADTAKPVSTAQQTALNLKADLASPTFTGTPTLPTGTVGATQAAGNNSTALATTAFATCVADYGSYKTITHASGSHTAARVAGTYFLPHGDALGITGTGTLYSPVLIHIVGADYPTVNGVAPKLRIRVILAVNDVAPTGNFTFGLYPVTRPATSGGAGVNIYTMGTVVTGSAGATFTAPAADSQGTAVSADFALPADGVYVIGVVTTASVAVSSHLHATAMLQYRNN